MPSVCDSGERDVGAFRGLEMRVVSSGPAPGSSSARLECSVRDREVGSSNLPFPTASSVAELPIDETTLNPGRALESRCAHEVQVERSSHPAAKTSAVVGSEPAQ
jgi:hypothetical protein